MQTQRSYCARSICVVAGESVNCPQAQGMGSLTPQ